MVKTQKFNKFDSKSKKNNFKSLKPIKRKQYTKPPLKLNKYKYSIILLLILIVALIALFLALHNDTIEIYIISDIKNNGVSGGDSKTSDWITSTTPYHIRELNNLTMTPIVNVPNASYDSTSFTLRPGKWNIEISVPAYKSDASQARLFNLSDEIPVKYSNIGFSNVTVQIILFIQTIINITKEEGDKMFQVQQVFETGQGTSGLGKAATFGVDENIFTQVKLIKMK